MIYHHGKLVSVAPAGLWTPSVAMVVRRDGRILMGLRQGSHGAQTWGLPAGSLEPGEKVYSAALRELAEETGLRGRVLRILAEHYDMLEGSPLAAHAVFIEIEAKGEPQILEPHRCAAWRWFDPEELPEPLFDPFVAILLAQDLEA